jgi:SAM-dependent methyltransferase
MSKFGTHMLNGPSDNLAATRYKWALQQLERLRLSPPSNVVFDIGAGDGRMKVPVEALEYSWHGFDLIPSSPNISKWNLADPCPVLATRPDAVLLLDVIEHLVNPGIALANIAKVLQPGGWLVMTMPNPRWSRSRVHALIHGNPACFTQSDLDLNGHVFTPWPHILIRMLQDTGFELEDHVTLDGKSGLPERPLSIRYPLRFGHALLLMLIERLDASACGMSYGLVARIPR